jgi:hypothetical protein
MKLKIIDNQIDEEIFSPRGLIFEIFCIIVLLFTILNIFSQKNNQKIQSRSKIKSKGVRIAKMYPNSTIFQNPRGSQLITMDNTVFAHESSPILSKDKGLM